jgi:hypothetical protein
MGLLRQRHFATVASWTDQHRSNHVSDSSRNLSTGPFSDLSELVS